MISGVYPAGTGGGHSAADVLLLAVLQALDATGVLKLLSCSRPCRTASPIRVPLVSFYSGVPGMHLTIQVSIDQKAAVPNFCMNTNEFEFLMLTARSKTGIPFELPSASATHRTNAHKLLATVTNTLLRQVSSGSIYHHRRGTIGRISTYVKAAISFLILDS